MAGVDDALHVHAGVFQRALVDVHQRDCRIGKRREGQYVAGQRAGEVRAARADEYEFLAHGKILLITYMRLKSDNTKHIPQFALSRAGGQYFSS